MDGERKPKPKKAQQIEEGFYPKNPVCETFEQWVKLSDNDTLKKYGFMARAQKYKEKDLITYTFTMPSLAGKKVKYTFLEASVKAFVAYSQTLDPKLRTGNIVLLEDEPIVGYCDLEFPYSLNTKNDPLRMVKTWFRHLFWVWKSEFPDQPELTMEQFLVLTSSKDGVKASYHIHGPLGYSWEQMYHWKAFCHLVVESIRAESKKKTKTPEKAEAKEFFILHLIEKGTNQEETTFVDMAVFNNNQHFRIYGQTKAAEYRPFIVDKNFELPPLFAKLTPEELEYQLTLHSIPNAVPPNYTRLKIKDNSLYLSVLPRNAFRRDDSAQKTKYAFFLFKYPEADEKTATHCEQRAEMQYRLVNDKLDLYKKMSQEKMKYCTWEILSPKTCLILEFKDIQIDKDYPGTDTPFLTILQEVIHDELKQTNSGYILQVMTNVVRFQWPGISVQKEEGSKITAMLLEALTDRSCDEFDFKKNGTDVYVRGMVLMPGSYDFTSPDRCNCIGEFDVTGAVTPKKDLGNKLQLLQDLSVRFE